MKIIKLFPGIVLSIAIAALACWLESLLPIHLIGSAVIAMFIGMFLNQFVRLRMIRVMTVSFILVISQPLEIMLILLISILLFFYLAFFQVYFSFFLAVF